MLTSGTVVTYLCIEYYDDPENMVYETVLGKDVLESWTVSRTKRRPRSWVPKHNRPKVLKDTNCPHCGVGLLKKGLGAHVRSLACLSTREKYQAALDGYVCGPIQYNRYTAPFMRRYLTKAVLVDNRAGTLRFETYYELTFARMWLRACVNEFHNVEPPAYFRRHKTARSKGHSQFPKPAFQDMFKEFAEAKRNGATRKIAKIYDNFEIQKELLDM
ncbi:hypothetical protein HC928_02330 [bacterium]|nr:hypothetical protein [bacterium]